MASSNSRDVELNLRVATLGEEGIRSLEERIRALAQEGGAAAPEFERLAQEVAQLGANASALKAFDGLAADMQQLSAASERSATTALSLAQDLVQLSEATKVARDSEAALKLEYEQAGAAAAGYQGQLATLRRSNTAAQQETVAYKDATAGLRLEILRANEELKATEAAYSAAKTAAKEAATEEANFAKVVNAATKEADANANALSQRNIELQQSRDALEAAGVGTYDLAESQARLLLALNETAVAADRLNLEVTRLAEQERQLAEFQAFEKLTNDAASLVKASDYVRFWEEALQQAERQAKETADQAKLSADQISNAFKTVGTTSVASLNTEIERVRAAMVTLQTTAGLSGAELNRAMALGNSKIADLERQIRSATGSLTLMDRAAGAMSETWAQVAMGFGTAAVAQKIVEWGTEAARGFVEANVALQALRLGLNAVYKDGSVTTQQIEFMRQTADRAGISTASISETFLKFSASMKAANIPMAQSNALFGAITQAAGTLGLNGDKVSHMLDALSQMASKGVVSMEELRQQLGDSLPGALSLTAQGLGITEGELVKLVESGGLLARDLFPALTKSLQSMSGEVDTLGSGWERMKNAFAISAQAAGDSGWTTVLTLGLKLLAGAAALVVIPLVSISETIFTFTRMIAAFLAPADSFTQKLRNMGEEATVGATRLRTVIDAFVKLGIGSDDAAMGVSNVADANARLTQVTQQAATGAAAHTTALQGTAAAAGTAATAHTQLSAATQQSTAATGQATQNVVQLGVAYAKLMGDMANRLEAAQKLTKATEVQIQASTALLKLSGDERAQLQGNVDAIESVMAAEQRELDVRKQEQEATRNYIAALQEQIKLQGDPDGSRAKQIADLQKKLVVMDAEVEKATNIVATNRILVESAKVVRQAYEDNSKSLDMYRTGMENSRATLQWYIELQKQGIATQAQVDTAKINAAKFEGLYRDALKDTAAAYERQQQAIVNKNTVAQAEISLDKQRELTLGALAKTTKDSTLARQAEISGIELEIQSRTKNADATIAEMKVQQDKIDKIKAETEKQGEWNDAKQAEYDKTKASIDAKTKEAEAQKESTKQLDQQIQQLRNAVQAESDYAASIDASTNAIHMKNKALEELYNRNRIITDPTKTADGFTKGADGAASGTFTNGLPVDLATKLKETGGKGMTPDEIAQAITQADNAYQDMNAFLKLNPGAASSAYVSSTTALKNAANTARQTQSAGTMGKTAPQTAGQLPSVGGTRTVNVNIGGNTTTINTASQTDSDNLVAMLQKLQTASKSAA